MAEQTLWTEYEAKWSTDSPQRSDLSPRFYYKREGKVITIRANLPLPEPSPSERFWRAWHRLGGRA